MAPAAHHVSRSVFCKENTEIPVHPCHADCQADKLKFKGYLVARSKVMTFEGMLVQMASLPAVEAQGFMTELLLNLTLSRSV